VKNTVQTKFSDVRAPLSAKNRAVRIRVQYHANKKRYVLKKVFSGLRWQLLGMHLIASNNSLQIFSVLQQRFHGAQELCCQKVTFFITDHGTTKLQPVSNVTYFWSFDNTVFYDCFKIMKISVPTQTPY